MKDQITLTAYTSYTRSDHLQREAKWLLPNQLHVCFGDWKKPYSNMQSSVERWCVCGCTSSRYIYLFKGYWVDCQKLMRDWCDNRKMMKVAKRNKNGCSTSKSGMKRAVLLVTSLNECIRAEDGVSSWTKSASAAPTSKNNGMCDYSSVYAEKRHEDRQPFQISLHDKYHLRTNVELVGSIELSWIWVHAEKHRFSLSTRMTNLQTVMDK